MNDQRFYSLKDLRAAAEDACAAAIEQDVSGSTDFPNLRCYEALQTINDVGEREFVVRVMEAMPEFQELQRFIMEYLHKRGFHGIDVELHL